MKVIIAGMAVILAAGFFVVSILKTMEGIPKDAAPFGAFMAGLILTWAAYAIMEED